MSGGLTGRCEGFFKNKILSIFLKVFFWPLWFILIVQLKRELTLPTEHPLHFYFKTRKLFMTRYKRKINTKQLTRRQWVFCCAHQKELLASSWPSQILNSPPRFTWRTIQIYGTVLFIRTDMYKEYKINKVRRREMLKNQAEYRGITGRPSL